MEVRPALVALAVVALALMPTAAAWTQLRGGPGRAGIAELTLGAIDIHDRTRLPEAEDPTAFPDSPGFVDTPHGLASVLRSSRDLKTCLLTFVGPAGATLGSKEVETCGNGRLVAYDSGADLILVCSAGGPGEPVLLAIRPGNGTLAWSIAAEQLRTDVQPQAWECSGGALDPERRELVIPFTGWDRGRPALHRIATISLDAGTPRWISTVPAALFAAPQDPTGRGGLAGAGGVFWPTGATVTLSGVIVTGRFCPSACRSTTEAGSPTGPQMAVAWLTIDGQPVAARTARAPERLAAAGPLASQDPAGVPLSGSRLAAASGPLGAMVLGGELVTINPARVAPVMAAPMPAHVAEPGVLGLPAPVWLDRLLVVPLAHSLSAHNALDLSPVWSWTETVEWTVEDVLGTPSGRLLVLLSRPPRSSLLLVQLSVADGRELQRLPLPDHDLGAYAAGETAKLAPGDDETVRVVDRLGGVNIVGPARGLGDADLAVSDAYPAPMSPVEVTLGRDVAANVSALLVNWGDGTSSQAGPDGMATHRYVDAGTYTVLVTAVHADGRTSTQPTLVHVGGTPPPELNVMQRAFAAENQDTTWGIIGTSLVALGAVTAVAKNRRRRLLLDRRFRELEAVRRVGASDPEKGLDALEAYRRRLAGELARGQIDDVHFSVIELRLARLMRALRMHFLAPYTEHLSHRFLRLLEAALEDGTLNDVEARTLLGQLPAEAGLTDDARESIRRIVSSWAMMSDAA